MQRVVSPRSFIKQHKPGSKFDIKQASLIIENYVPKAKKKKSKGPQIESIFDQGKYDYDISALEVDEQLENSAYVVVPINPSKVKEPDRFQDLSRAS